MMETIKEFFYLIAEIIDIIGVTILVYGFIKVLIKYFSIEFLKGRFNTAIRSLQEVRCRLAIYILLALDFLIASDIIHTIMEVTEKQLIELAAVVVLRTGIGYFLGREVEELHEKTVFKEN